MMKALFAHDHRFIRLEGKVGSESQFEASLWQRYLMHFDALTVVARRGTMPTGKNFSQLELSSAPSVNFELLENLSNFRGLTIGRWGFRQRMINLVLAHDAVIARLPSEIGLLAIDAARVIGKPYAVEVVGCVWDALWNYGSFRGRLYAPGARFRMRRAVRQADHVIYVTSSFLQDRYPTRAKNCAWASDVELACVSSDIPDRRCKRIAAIGDRPLKLGLIGTLHGRYKGIQTLFSALAQARSNLPPIFLHILGNGDARPWRSLATSLGIGDIVSFDGTLPAGEPIMRWLDEIDVYLQPSLQEGLPRALVEAMSRACPALASRAGGIPELLPAEDLIAPSDAAALATLLRRRLPDRQWMMARAVANWEITKYYHKKDLEARRIKFWRAFCNAANGADLSCY